ncbi:MAG: hypothetical protein NTZ87_00935 [Candidatus Nomurabacteria bacterium]|nr:hypothetical protein [Candidatus Nomurabacteria bacterium]
MKTERKNQVKILCTLILFLASVMFLTSSVFAQTQGYKRDPNYRSLSGSGDNSGSNSGSGSGQTTGSGSNSGSNSTGGSSGGESALPPTSPTSPINYGNTPALTPIQIGEPHQVYHPDVNYNNWASEAQSAYQKYGGEGAQYDSAIKALNQKYWDGGMPLPPASYYTTEYGTPETGTPNNSDTYASDATIYAEYQDKLKTYFDAEQKWLDATGEGPVIELPLQNQMGIADQDETDFFYANRAAIERYQSGKSNPVPTSNGGQIQPTQPSDQPNNQPQQPDSVTIKQDTLTESDNIAQSLGFQPLAVDSSGSVGDIKIYEVGTLPPLGDGDVIVTGAPTKVTTTSNGVDSTKTIDTYYVVNKYALPDNYTLQAIIGGEINIGGEQKGELTGIGIPILDENNVSTYKLMIAGEALAKDAQYSADGIFNFDFNNSPSNISKNIIMELFDALATTVTGNDAIMGHISTTMKENAIDFDVTLAKFGYFASDLSSDNLSQEQIERSIYDYVNNELKTQDPTASSISVSHNLDQAVALGQGICRDKATALEYGLEVAGISAARVISDSHIFVAVLNTDGSVNHYLDPMYYETYLPLPRTSVKPSQIINNNYAGKPIITPR